MARQLTWLVLPLIAACEQGTSEQTFTTDIRIDGEPSPDPDSADTQMCVTDDGAVYVVWLDDRLQRNTGRQDIWMNRSLDLGSSGSWFTSPVRVNQSLTEDEVNVWSPSIFCNEYGLFVAWEDDRDGELDNHQIYFNRWIEDSQAFLPEDQSLEVDPDGMSMSLNPRITGYGQDLYVVWYDNLNGAYDILVASSSDAGNIWRDPVRVDSDEPAGSAYSARPRIAVGQNGQDVWVVWEDSRDGAADIYFARSETGGTTFSEDERLDEGDADGEYDSFEPQLCSDGVSNVYAVWHDARNSPENRDIYYNYSIDAGDNWLGAATRLEGEKTTPSGQVVDNPGFGNSLFPVCVAEGNVGHVAWNDRVTDGQGYDIYYRRIEGGLSSSDAVRLDVGNDEQQPEPDGYANSVDTRIAFDAGRVFVAWADGRGEATAATPNGYDDLYYNYNENGGPFQEQDLRIDSMYSGASFKEDLNVDILGGTWFAAWTDGRNGTSDIYFQSFELGVQSEPPVRTADQTGAAAAP